MSKFNSPRYVWLENNRKGNPELEELAKLLGVKWHAYLSARDTLDYLHAKATERPYNLINDNWDT